MSADRAEEGDNLSGWSRLQLSARPNVGRPGTGGGHGPPPANRKCVFFWFNHTLVLLHMVQRPFWRRRLEQAWRRRSVIWLSGVRRSGKTFLCRSIPRVEYFDCELPHVRRRIEEPESFLRQMDRRRVVVLDEVHRLPNPAEVLKIAADYFPGTRVVATGSSTLGASARFRDTLAGRKIEVWLTPMALPDLTAFGNTDLSHRLLRGGLPPFFLAARPPEADFQEWTDAFWAKDILELFRLERRASFQRFLELLLAASGGIFEAARYARPCEVSRPTIANYLAVLEATRVAHVVRPFSAGGSAEIVAAPKVYGFDTGFVCHQRGWSELRREDMGSLWEHFVLNELHARLGSREVRYWRSKHGNEVDFVLPQPVSAPNAVECKWSADGFDPAGLRAFRNRYPRGRNFVAAADVEDAFERGYSGLRVRFVGLEGLIRALDAQRGRRTRGSIGRPQHERPRRGRGRAPGAIIPAPRRPARPRAPR
jgi:predicted AAA+ superfamily ATPase